VPTTLRPREPAAHTGVGPVLPPYARGHAGDAFTITAWGANTRSRGNLVLVDESTQEISSPDVRHDTELRDWRSRLGS